MIQDLKWLCEKYLQIYESQVPLSTHPHPHACTLCSEVRSHGHCSKASSQRTPRLRCRLEPCVINTKPSAARCCDQRCVWLLEQCPSHQVSRVEPTSPRYGNGCDCPGAKFWARLADERPSLGNGVREHGRRLCNWSGFHPQPFYWRGSYEYLLISMCGDHKVSLEQTLRRVLAQRPGLLVGL